MAAQQTVIAQLTRFATTLRHKLSPEELAALALTWGELFQTVPDAEFAAACALLLRRCRFFPTPAETAAALRELRAQPRPAAPALPPARPDPAQLWIAEISGRVCRQSYQNPGLRPLAAEYYNSTLKSRRNSADNTPIILVMQRLHPDDLIGWILENEPEDWRVVSYPALRNGQPLNPMTTSPQFLEKLRSVAPQTYWAQYMQSPVVQGGNIIKLHWWKTYKTLGAAEQEKQTRRSHSPGSPDAPRRSK